MNLGPFELIAGLLLAPAAFAQNALSPVEPTQHPALFLVGDSIMKTGTGNGERGPWGMGYELVPLFDRAKIHVYNEGLGGRSSRGYIEEGAWAGILGRLQAGDYVLLMFGHNDAANSQNYPDRLSLKGDGDETQEIESPATHKKETIHTYGWYLRQYGEETKARGATAILCSPVPRNSWVEGKIKRGFDGYAAWAAEAARMSGVQFLDLNTLAANHYDVLGREKAAAYFNDTQHTTKAGARLNAESVVEGLKLLREFPLTAFLAASPTTTAETEPSLPALYVLGDSTAAEQTRVPTIQGWGVPFLAYFDPSRIRVINAARGGRSSRTFITEGLLDAVVARLKPGDTVLIQFGHNDVFPLNDNVSRGSLHGLGEETEEIDNKVTGKHEVVHTYGWYLRKFVNDIRAKGASPVILTLTIRDRWNKDGKIERLPEPDLDLANTNRFTAPSIYSIWAQEVAKTMNVPVIDVHSMIADRYDREGPEIVSTYFNSPGDPTHRNPLGAEVDAAITLAGLKALRGQGFGRSLSEKGQAIPAAHAKYIFQNAAAPPEKTTPDPKEIPVPPIATSMKAMPGVDKLPNRREMPDVLTMNNGQKVKTAEQWKRRREEMKRILEYYAVGQAPPAPGNVKGREISSQVVMNGKVKYRLVHLTFGPRESLSLDIGIFTPTGGGPFPTLISPSGSPPGATPLPRLPQGPTQGKGTDVLLVVGPAVNPNAPAVAPGGRGGFGGPRTAESVAASNPALAHGFAFVTFNNNDCGEDTTLRHPDGSWAFRNTRFYPAYPKYDWGLLQGWAWGVSRIVDYLETDSSIDKTKLIVTGVSRTGKSALVAGAFDDRLAMVAPVASSGGGTPAYRFSGAERGGKEGLSEMMRKYPNWFSPHLHEFWGQPDKLPFDEHWFIALAAPRPFIALEGTHDQNVNANGVRQAWLAALPAFALFDASDRLGVNWSDRPHGMVQGDWDALLAFADKYLLQKAVSRRFDDFPAELFASH